MYESLIYASRHILCLRNVLTQKFKNQTKFQWCQDYIPSPPHLLRILALYTFFKTHVDLQVISISIRLWPLQSLFFDILGPWPILT